MDSQDWALLIGDLAGVAVFAASGGSAAVVKRLDIFGVVFVGFVAALGGGIFRDLVCDTTIIAFNDWRYIATAAVVSAAVFWFHAGLGRLRWTVLLLDAAGLALFTVTGTVKALSLGITPPGACLIGMLTGIGGGLARDLLLGEIPVVLRRELYAFPALLGALLVVLLHPARLVPFAAGALIFVVRLTALLRGWSAPRPRLSGAGDAMSDR